MLDVHDVQGLLDRVSYKPNVKLEAAYNNTHLDISVHAVMYTLNSRQRYPKPSRWIGLSLSGVEIPHTIVFPEEPKSYWREDDSRIPPLPDRLYVDMMPIKIAQQAIVPWPILERGEEQEFFHWLKLLLMQLEDHEMSEWFRVDGELVDDPHA